MVTTLFFLVSLGMSSEEIFGCFSPDRNCKAAYIGGEEKEIVGERKRKREGKRKKERERTNEGKKEREKGKKKRKREREKGFFSS